MAKSRKDTESKFGVTAIASGIALVALVAGLLLSAYNLALVVGQSGELGGLKGSWNLLLNNYDSALASKGPVPPVEPIPAVLWSVARYRDGEPESIETKLVNPILAHSLTNGPKYEGILIERKNAGSRDVLVRLFHVDGTEESYLWPSTHSDTDGYWVASKE